MQEVKRTKRHFGFLVAMANTWSSAILTRGVDPAVDCEFDTVARTFVHYSSIQ